MRRIGRRRRQARSCLSWIEGGQAVIASRANNPSTRYHVDGLLRRFAMPAMTATAGSPPSSTPTRKTHPSPSAAASSASPPASAARPWQNPPPCPTARSPSAPAAPPKIPDGGATKAADLLAVFLRQYRAGDVGDPAARLYQSGRAIEHFDLVLQPHLERAGAHPPFGVGVAPPGAGAGAGRVDQHEIGRGVDVGERVVRRPSACGRRHCARRRATAARGSARAGACRGRSRSAGPCPASSPPAPASCRRRRRRDRSPARRVLPPTASAASCEPSSCTSMAPLIKSSSAWMPGLRASAPSSMRRPSGDHGVGCAPRWASDGSIFSRLAFSVLTRRSSGARLAIAVASATRSSPNTCARWRIEPFRIIAGDMRAARRPASARSAPRVRPR